MKHHQERAFTLVEILVALAIGVAVAGLGAVGYTKLRESTHDSKVKADAVTLNRAIDVFMLGGGAVPADMTAKDVIQILKSVPSANLQRETTAFRLLGDSALGISPYNEADGRQRLLFAGGRFSAVNGGSGWLLDKSGNVQVTEESRQVYGMKFGGQSKWLWNTDESSGSPTSASGSNLTVTTNAPFDGASYRITAPGTYGFTATTTAITGNLGLQVGPFSKSIGVTAGAQSIIQAIAIGPGAQFTLIATGALAAPGANQTKQVTVIVDVPGATSATPKTLEVIGASTVNVRASEGTHHENYTYLLTYSDGTILTGPISNPALGDFTWRADVATESKVITDTQKGLSASKNVTVSYLPQFTVAVNVNPVGSGAASIVVPNSSGVYDQGTPISLSAAPNLGYDFVSWSGGASGNTNQTSVTVNSNLAITANFAPTRYKLNATAAAGGAVSISTPSVGISADGAPLFAAGTNVSVVAIPDAGYNFAGWGGTNGSSVTGGTPGVIVMNSDKSIVGNFDTTPTYRLHVELSDPSAGSPNGSTSGLSVGTSSPVSVTLNSGWRITGASVSGGATITGSGSDNARVVTMGSSDVTVTYGVSAVSPNFSLTVAVSNPAAGTPNGSDSGLSSGDTRNVSVSLNSGFKIDSVSLSGAGAILDGSVTDNVRNVTIGNEDVTVTYNVSAVAAPGKFTLSTSVAGSGSVTGDGDYEADAVATVTATPSSGWNFSHWAGANGGEVSGSIITMNGNKSVEAVFAQKLVTTTWAAQALGGSGKYKFTRITIAAVGNVTPTFEQQSAGGFAETTASLPLGSYTLSAEIEDEDTGEKASVTAQIEVVDN